MLLNVIDANGVPRVVNARGVETPVDRPGTIAAAGVSQQVAAASTTRSGWFVQNLSAIDVLLVNDLGLDALAASSMVIGPGEKFGTGDYPPTATAVNVAGATLGQPFVFREW